jgi:hypothetical protein
MIQLYQYWKTHSDSVLLVRYEDMILDPQKTYHKICQYVGINNSSETIHQMLVAASETNIDMQKVHQTSSSVVSSIGRFKTTLSQNDINLMNDMLQLALIEFGYELSVG